MIQQQHLEPYPTQEVSGLKKISMPGMGVDIKQVMQMYFRGTMEEKAKGYYERQGMEIPDFHLMSKIERLEKLGEYHKLSLKTDQDLANQQKVAQKAKMDAILQQTVKQKVDEELKRKSSPDK